MKFASSLLVLAAGTVSASFVPGQNVFDRRAGIQPPIQGDIPFKIPGRNITSKTHFWAYGNYKNLGVTPLVVLHGGPGIPSNYLTPLADLAAWMPVIIYDQIGSGTSSHFPDTIGDTSFWTEALFEAELKNLIKALGIENNFSLYGHSWGGMLGARFAATQPKGLKKLVLASSPATIPLWLKVANELRDKLPEKYRKALDEHEADGTTDDPEYLAAVQYFYDLHVVRVLPNPADVQASFAGLGEDPTVYLTMNGPNEFSIIGPLKDWSGLKYGPKIKVPTLLTNGKYDEGQDACIQPWYDLIPNVKWIHFQNSSHMAFWEERTAYIAAVKKFLL